MPPEHHENMIIDVDHAARRMLFEHWGVLNRESALRSYRVIHGVERFDPSYDTLVDYRGITEVALGPSDLKEILKEAKAIEQRTARAALVVGPDPGRHAFATLFSVLSSTLSRAKLTYRAFKTMEEADAWLDGN